MNLIARSGKATVSPKVLVRGCVVAVPSSSESDINTSSDQDSLAEEYDELCATPEHVRSSKVQRQAVRSLKVPCVKKHRVGTRPDDLSKDIARSSSGKSARVNMQNSTSTSSPCRTKKVPRRRRSNNHITSELLSIDARIHSLEAEIAGSDPSLASPHHLAAKHDSLVDLYMRKGEITRQPEDFAAATRNNTAAVQAGQLALTPELLNGISSDEIGSCWCFQGARLAWRSRVLTKNGNRAGRATSDGIDSAATDQAIDAYDHALTQLPSQRSSLRREAAHNRANLLGARFDLTGSMNDIDEAIASGDVALAGAHSGMLPAVCNDVGILYQQRGRLNANIAVLQRAIELGVRSIEDVDCPERIRVERILNLNVSRKLLYNLTRQVHQLEETRRELFQAAALCEQGRGQKTAHVLVRLATVAHLLAADTGIVGYHVEAVQFAHEGLENARTDDIVNEHAELIWVMATTLSETDAHGRSIEDLAKVLKKGESPL